MSDTLDPNRDSSDFDALAELFLGDNGSPAPKAHAPRHHAIDPGPNGHRADVVGSIGIDDAPDSPVSPPAHIEALVVGHLPVRTGPWLAQYAAGVARADRRPVALLRIADGEVRIDLVDGAAPGHPTPPESLEEAIAVAASRAARWMIEADDLDVPWLLHCPLVDWITLLAGGNEAALVDAYRTIKALVAGTPHDDPSATDPEGDASGPAIRVAIMGADEQRAREVADRLRDASRAFLGREIELAAGIREMGPTGATPLFRGRTTLDIRAILDELRRGSRLTPTPPASAPARPAPLTTPAPVPMPETAEAPAAWSSEPAARSTVKQPRSDAEATDLAALLDAFADLAVPYPDDPSVQFAIDEDSCLHILRLDADGHGDAVSSLTAASAWATRHLPLINLAIAPRGPLRADTAPALHLFTRRPKALRSLLDAEIRLHALAPVRRDREWVSLDLN